MLAQSGKQEEATTLDLLVRHFHVAGGKSDNHSGTWYFSEISRSQLCAAYRYIPSGKNGRLLPLAPPTTKMRHMLSGPLGVWRQNISLLGVSLWPICQLTHQTASVEWVPEQEKALQQIQVLSRLFCHLGHVTQQIWWCIEVSVSECCLEPLADLFR